METLIDKTISVGDILLVHPRISNVRSGTADFVSAAARNLFERGLKVSVFTSTTLRTSVATEIPVAGFGPETGWKSFHRLFHFAQNHRGSTLSFQWTCAEQGNRGFAFLLFLAMLSLRLLGHRTHVYVHQLWEPWGNIMHWPWALWSRIETLAVVLVARRVSVPVQGWTRFLKNIFFFKSAKIAWVPVGATILPRHRSLGSRERQSHPVVLLFNPLSTTKNPELVEAAWARLAQKAPHMQCAVIGKVPARDEKRFGYLLRHTECTFLGVIRSNQVSQWMSQALALLAPFDEGVSGCRTSVTSALAHGLPVVTTRGRATESIWENTPGVIIVDRNPEDLADALLRLHADESYWERASQGAQAFYKKNFDWNRVTEKLYPEFGESSAAASGAKPRLQTVPRSR